MLHIPWRRSPPQGGPDKYPALALTAMLVACGGAAPFAPTSTVPTTPAASTARVIWDSSAQARPRDPGLAAVSLEQVPNVPAGPVTVTLDWTPSSSDLRLQVTNFDCPGGLLNGVFANNQCFIYAQADAVAAGAQRIDFVNTTTRGLAFWISNYGLSAANYRLRVSVPSSSAAPAPTPLSTPRSGPLGEVALLGSSIPFGQSVPTVRLGTAGQAAPSLTFTISVRIFSAETGVLARVWVRNDTVRCMGTGIANLNFAAGEQKVLNTFNVSFQNGNDPAPCRLPYTTSLVEITLNPQTGPEFSQIFPGSFTFLPPS